MKDKKVDTIDKSKIPKFGIHKLSGLKIKKKNAIISAKGNLVICSARCCAKYLKNGFKAVSYTHLTLPTTIAV